MEAIAVVDATVGDYSVGDDPALLSGRADMMEAPKSDRNHDARCDVEKHNVVELLPRYGVQTDESKPLMMFSIDSHSENRPISIQNPVRKKHSNPEKFVKRWPSRLMELMSANDDDEWLPVMARIRSHPDEIMIAGRNGGMTALHAACVRYPPEQVVEAIVKVRPEAALIQNVSGETPLLLATYCSSEAVQQILLREKPEAARLRDKYGDCPLHFAARQGATLPVMEEFIQAAPEMISMANNRGVTPFWVLPRSYLEVENWEDLMDDEEEDYGNDWDLLVLFLRYSYFGAEKARLMSGARSANRSDYNWVVAAAANTPSCPREALQFLCAMFPDQALQYNEDGFTPLLLAVQAPEMEEPSCWDEDEDGYREPVEAAEGSVTAEDVIPEDVASLHGDSDFMQRVIFDPVEATDDKCQSVVDILLEWSPKSVMLPDKNGRLPLAHALVSGQSWTVVRRLVAAYPRAIECRDNTGFNMFHLAAIHSPQLDTLYNLMRCSPDLLLNVMPSFAPAFGNHCFVATA